MLHFANMWWLTNTFSSRLVEGVGVLLSSYALGCFATGYYVVILSAKQDVRQLGSGGIGARNVGRHAGMWGFMVTLLGDSAKGAMAVWATDRLIEGDWFKVLALLSVVSGHIWPIQLGFRGGKGIATAFGALLVFDLSVVVVMAGLCLGACVLIRRTVISGLLAFACAPLASLCLAQPTSKFVGLCALSALVLLAHRKNLVEEFAALDSNQSSKT